MKQASTSSTGAASTVADHGTASSNSAPARAPSSDIEYLKLACEQYRTNVTNFWARSNLFLLLTGALISVFVVNGQPGYLRLGIPILGLLVVTFWYMTLDATYHWVRYWRAEVARVDNVIGPFKVFHQAQMVAIQRGFRVTPDWIAKWLPLLMGAAWVAVTILWLFSKGRH
jgi:hypothetical protein